MSKSDTKERLQHMLENAQKVRELKRNLKRADLDEE